MVSDSLSTLGYVFFEKFRAMRITVVMTTYESPKSLDKVLEGYALQSRTPDEVVVADDGSTVPVAAPQRIGFDAVKS